MLGRRLSKWIHESGQLKNLAIKEAQAQPHSVSQITSSFGHTSLGHNRIMSELQLKVKLKSGQTKNVNFAVKVTSPEAVDPSSIPDLNQEMFTTRRVIDRHPSTAPHLTETFIVDKLPAAKKQRGIDASFLKTLTLQVDQMVHSPTIYDVKRSLEERFVHNPARRRTAVRALLRDCVHHIIRIWDVTRQEDGKGIVPDTGTEDILVQKRSSGRYLPIFVDPDCYRNSGGLSSLLDGLEILIADIYGVDAKRASQFTTNPRSGYLPAKTIVEEMVAVLGKSRGQILLKNITNLPPLTLGPYLTQIGIRRAALDKLELLASK